MKPWREVITSGRGIMSEIDPYGLDPGFEKAVASLCAGSPKFVGSVGHVLDHEALDDPAVQLIVKVTKSIYKDTGRGPSHPSVLLQRIRRLHSDGLVSKKDLNSVADVLIEAPYIPEPEVVSELAPILKKRMQADVVRNAMSAYSSKDPNSFEKVASQINAVERIGKVDTSVGLRMGKESFAEIDRVRRVQRLPMGIPELDTVFRGGAVRGTCTLFVAGPGGGKSMMLSHIAAHNLAYGMFGVYATLELPDVEVMARVKAALTGVPTAQISAGDHKVARQELRRLYPTLGTFLVQRFSPKHTRFADIRDWITECEEAEGYPVDCVFIDYIDKLKGNNSRDNEYIAQGEQTEEFRVFLEERGKWGFTGSQATIKNRDLRKRTGIGDVRDSSRKIDVADAVVTLTKDPEGQLIEYFVGKNRYGVSEVSVGPLPHDWEHGRMVVP